MFKDRMDAGTRLAKALAVYKREKETIVLAIPRGGVLIGYALKKVLQLPLEVVLVKKIGHPRNPEYAIGNTDLTDYVVDESLGIPEEHIRKQVEKARALLRERQGLYYGKRKPLRVKGKTVILTDDGIATGNTMMAAVRLARQKSPKQIIIAVPVAPGDVIGKLDKMVDRVVCLLSPQPFEAVGLHYRDFRQLSDADVRTLLTL